MFFVKRWNFTKFTGKYLCQTTLLLLLSLISNTLLHVGYSESSIVNQSNQTFEYWKKQPPQVFCKKSARKNFEYFTGKDLCWSLFIIMLQDCRTATSLKSDSNAGAFLWKVHNFQESFEQVGELGLSYSFNLATYSNFSITNYVKIPVSHFFEKANKGDLKIVNVNY